MAYILIIIPPKKTGQKDIIIPQQIPYTPGRLTWNLKFTQFKVRNIIWTIHYHDFRFEFVNLRGTVCLPNQPFFFVRKKWPHMVPPRLNPTGFPRWLMTRPRFLTRLGSARGRVVTPGTWTSWRSKNLRRWCSEMSGIGVYTNNTLPKFNCSPLG